MKRTAAGLAVIVVLTGVAACDSDNQCTDVCDENGQGLIYAPYLIPAYGIYGQPGYRPGVTIYPGAPNYHTTYVNKPPNYNPPVAPRPPAANPGNAKPSVPVKAPAPAVKAPAPAVKAPKVGK